MKKINLLLSMIVKNEENRFLEKVLNAAKKYVDFILIIDDSSTDNTAYKCKELLAEFPHKIIQNETSLFANETILRSLQWQESLKLNPEWILILDADELFEDSISDQISDLLQTEKEAIYFRLYDFWSESEYREDEHWYAHKIYRPFIIKNKPDITYSFHNMPQHCGRFPAETVHFSYHLSDIRLKHLGWSRAKDRQEKFERYLKLDPDGKFGNMAQYISILDENPNLIKFEEEAYEENINR